MSLTNLKVKEIYQGDAALVSFAIPFAFQNNSEIVAIARDESVTPAVETTDTLGVEYNFDNASAPTALVYVTAPPATTKILIRRDTSKTQPTVYDESEAFPADAHESALDKNMQVIQENGEKVDRALVLGKSIASNVIRVIPDPEAESHFNPFHVINDSKYISDRVSIISGSHNSNLKLVKPCFEFSFF